MDENLISPLPPETQIANDSSSFRDKISGIKIIFMFVLLLVIGSGALFALSNSSTSNNQNTKQAESIQSLDLAPYSLVFGTWDSSSSHINAFDLASGKEYSLAILPSNIKKVTLLDAKSFLFIGNTDVNDYGKNISQHDIGNNSDTVVIKADDGFGIDDYVVSPDNRYVADWEVATSSAGVLSGGKSRVYTVDLQNPSTKHLIYDETADHPVHYPRGILNNGTVYTDTFLPNSGAGWAYGMSVSDFTGDNKQDLANMTNGTYGTQPKLSPDGKYFVFAGYDGKNGDGTAEDNGFRRALISSDTIELLDTSNNQLTKLPNLSDADTFSNISWSVKGDSIIYTQIASGVAATYSYSLTTRTAQEVTLKSTDQNTIASLSNNQFLIGQADSDTSTVGNLGSTYSPAFSNLSVFDNNARSTSSIPLNSSLIQYIGTEPAGSFAQLATVINDTHSRNIDQLQLETFSVKPSLAPIRETQQTQPPPQGKIPLCRTISQARCGCYSTSYWTPNPQCNACVWALRNAGECYGSPLYIYGPSGTQVDVKILAALSGASPAYSNGYHVTLGENGDMVINNNTYKKISYNYIPVLRKITPPLSGAVVSTKNLEEVLASYAAKLELNAKETQNLITETQAQVLSPYVFISFFDQDTSQAILPISFSPKPDVYRNIVFYFKQLDSKPNYSIQPPTFDPITRHGLTAIEISEIVE